MGVVLATYTPPLPTDKKAIVQLDCSAPICMPKDIQLVDFLSAQTITLGKPTAPMLWCRLASRLAHPHTGRKPLAGVPCTTQAQPQANRRQVLRRRISVRGTALCVSRILVCETHTVPLRLLNPPALPRCQFTQRHAHQQSLRTPVFQPLTADKPNNRTTQTTPKPRELWRPLLTTAAHEECSTQPWNPNPTQACQQLPPNPVTTLIACAAALRQCVAALVSNVMPCCTILVQHALPHRCICFRNLQQDLRGGPRHSLGHLAPSPHCNTQHNSSPRSSRQQTTDVPQLSAVVII